MFVVLKSYFNIFFTVEAESKDKKYTGIRESRITRNKIRNYPFCVNLNLILF